MSGRAPHLWSIARSHIENGRPGSRRRTSTIAPCVFSGGHSQDEFQLRFRWNLKPNGLVTSVDGGYDETRLALLRLPDDVGVFRLLAARENSSTRILRCAEFFDQELHCGRQVAANRHAEYHRCQRR